jgi:hypothetical protein
VNKARILNASRRLQKTAKDYFYGFCQCAYFFISGTSFYNSIKTISSEKQLPLNADWMIESPFKDEDLEIKRIQKMKPFICVVCHWQWRFYYRR